MPLNDEMTLVSSAYSVAKTNVYRSLVDQPLLAGNVNPTTVAADYCQNMVDIAPAHNQLDFARDANFASPVPGTGDNLATFLAARLSASFGVLGCTNFGLTDPVTVTVERRRRGHRGHLQPGPQAATGATPASGSTATADPTPTARPVSGGGGFSWGYGLGTQENPGTVKLPPSRRGHHEDVTGM